MTLVTATVTHPFVSAKVNGGDPSQVSSNAWNAPHTVVVTDSQIAAGTVLGNLSGGPSAPIATSVAALAAAIGLFSSVLSGLVPASGGGTTKFLRADGTWAQVPFSNLSGSATLSQLPLIGSNTVLGNASGISAVPSALTTTQLTMLINQFTSVVGGAVPASGGGTANFLRADGAWAAPPGGGGGGGGTPGGADTDIQFNSAGSFSGDSGFTYAGNGQATLALGTITANAKALNITGTWNNAAVAFDAPLFMNITNTASASGSLLADLQVGGSSKFQVVGATGDVIANASGSGITGYWFANTFHDGMVINNSTQFLDLFVSGTGRLRLDGAVTGGAFVASTAPIGWGSSGLSTPDTFVWRDAANIIAQRNSTNAQTFRVYNTFTDSSNYERGVFDWTTSSNVLTIGTQYAGTGSQRRLDIYGDNGVYVKVGNGQPWYFFSAADGLLGFSSGGGIGWTSTGDGAGTRDTGLKRAVPQVIQITDGSGSSGHGATWSAVSNTPSTLASGSTANYAISQASYFQRLTANASNSTLSGISVNSAAQVDGEVHVIVNVAASGTLTLSHQDAGSTAGNRFLCSTGASIVLSANQAADIIYDATVSRWLVFKRN
jgi:hypothetical protein